MPLDQIESRVRTVYNDFVALELGEDPETLSDGGLDSLTFLVFVAELEKVFGVEIDPEEVDHERFGTSTRIARFLATKLSLPLAAVG